ncbi:MAG: tetratricopeptide repeat protein [Elainellaceae cyanobacterium]
MARSLIQTRHNSIQHNSIQHNSGRRGWSWAGIALAGLLAIAPPAIAQPPPFLLDPITDQDAEPLVDEAVVEGDRSLTSEEALELEAALDDLRQEGLVLDQQGQRDAAYEIWVRELRLRQFLGYRAEIEALNWLGQRAFQDDRTEELRAVGDRLALIEAMALEESDVDLDLWITIAQTYETVRKKDEAIAAYIRVLDYSRQQRDAALEQSTLQTLGQLYLNWFDYGDAATTYQELAQILQRQGDRAQEAQALENLAYAYEQDQQYLQAIATQERLIELYTADVLERTSPEQINQVQVMPVPRLKIAIANNYQALGRYDRAAINYQAALTAAQLSQQFGYASDALRQLAELYKTIERFDDAVVAYRRLVDVEQQSYSVYGMMQAYDEIGRIHRDRGQIPQSLAAFEQALRLAQQLGFREAYFERQLLSVRPPLRPVRVPEVAPEVLEVLGGSDAEDAENP